MTIGLDTNVFYQTIDPDFSLYGLEVLGIKFDKLIVQVVAAGYKSKEFEDRVYAKIDQQIHGIASVFCGSEVQIKRIRTPHMLWTATMNIKASETGRYLPRSQARSD